MKLREVTKVTKMQKPAYESLKFYQDLCEIRRFVNQICERFERTRPKLASQMRDAARSAKQNIREGYRRGSLREFMRAVKISQGSLEELEGDIEIAWKTNSFPGRNMTHYPNILKARVI